MNTSSQRGIAEVNGTKLAYEIAGEGHPLVLLHGGLIDKRGWDDQFATFAQHYKVIRYDMRAFGDSAVPTESFSLLDDLHSLLTFLNIDSTYLLGLSMGGSLAIDYTLAHPERIDALVAVAASVSGNQPPELLQRQIEEVDAALESSDVELAVELENRIWTDGPNRAPDQVNPTVRARVHEMNRNNYRLQTNIPSPHEPEKTAIDRLSEIRVPTLIIVGDQDVEHVQKTAVLLADTIVGAKKVVITNTAHHLHMEEPEQFNQIVLNFLDTLPSRE